MRDAGAVRFLGGVLEANQYGVFHLRGISHREREAVLSFNATPPVFPLFLPKFIDDPLHGEGLLITKYSFDRKRVYWGQFGAAGVAIRRQRASGEWEYLLGKRSNVSSGNGSWAFFGGAHDSFEHAADPTQTIRKELEEEAGIAIGDAAKWVARMAYEADPDWRYETFVVELPQAEEVAVTLNWEHSEANWFSANELLALRKSGQLFRPVARDIELLLALVS